MTSAPVDERDVEQPRDADDEEMPRVVITRERALGFGVFVAASIAFLYFVLPKISGGTSGQREPPPGGRGTPSPSANVWISSAAIIIFRAL